MLLATLVFTSVGVGGSYLIRQKFEPELLLPAESYLRCSLGILSTSRCVTSVLWQTVEGSARLLVPGQRLVGGDLHRPPQPHAPRQPRHTRDQPRGRGGGRPLPAGSVPLVEQVISNNPMYLPDLTPAQPEGLRGDPHQPELLDRADRQPRHLLHRALGLALPLQRLGPQAGVQVNISCPPPHLVTTLRGLAAGSPGSCGATSPPPPSSPPRPSSPTCCLTAPRSTCPPSGGWSSSSASPACPAHSASSRCGTC